MSEEIKKNRFDESSEEREQLDVKRENAIKLLISNIKEAPDDFFEENAKDMGYLNKKIRDIYPKDTDIEVGVSELNAHIDGENKITSSDLAKIIVENLIVHEAKDVVREFILMKVSIELEEINKEAAQQVKNITNMAFLIKGDS